MGNTIIPTAEELFGKHFGGMHFDDITPEMTEKYAIEFAKLHVEAALIEASAKATTSDDIDGDSGEGSFWVNKESILSAYPLSNII